MLLCLGSLSCFFDLIVAKLYHIWFYNPLAYQWVHGWLNDCKMPGSSGCKISPGHHWACVSFFFVFISSNVELCVMARHLNFGPTCPKKIGWNVLWFVQMQICKSKLYCHVFVLEGFFARRKKRFSPGNIFKQATLEQSFPDCSVMNFWCLTCRLSAVEPEVKLLGFLAVSPSLAWSELWVNLHPLLGRLASF